jgi:hypothetical protein
LARSSELSARKDGYELALLLVIMQASGQVKEEVFFRGRGSTTKPDERSWLELW